MRRVIILMVCLMCVGMAAEAQMPTDNSYVRENYQNSKTAKKRALKKAERQKRKTERQKAKTGKSSQSAEERGEIRTPQKSKISGDTVKTPQKSKIFGDPVNPAPTGETAEPYYMEGALKTDSKGKVVFEYTIKANDAEKAMQAVMSVLGEVVAHTEDNGISKIDSAGKDMVKATLCEPIYFKQKKWAVDSTLIRYSFVAENKGGVLHLRATNINYSYESGPTIIFDYPAEEWITDEYALSKDKKKLTKNAGKFRVKTIDYFRELFTKTRQRLAPMMGESI